MKFFVFTFTFTFAYFYFLQLALAQNVSELPACGQYCVNEASSIAVSTAHCSVDHANCYCTRGDFVNQVKTCITKECTSTADQSTVNAFVKGYCADATAASTVSGGYSSSSTSAYTSKTTETETKPKTSASHTPTTVTSAPSIQQPVKASGLSTGAKVGIGAGIPLGLLAIIILLFLAWRRKRKNITPSQNGRENRYEVQEPVLGTASPEYRIKELYVPPPVIHELPTGNRPGQRSRVPGDPYSPSLFTELGTASPTGTRE